MVSSDPLWRCEGTYPVEVACLGWVEWALRLNNGACPPTTYSAAGKTWHIIIWIAHPTQCGAADTNLAAAQYGKPPGPRQEIPNTSSCPFAPITTLVPVIPCSWSKLCNQLYVCRIREESRHHNYACRAQLTTLISVYFIKLIFSLSDANIYYTEVEHSKLSLEPW